MSEEVVTTPNTCRECGDGKHGNCDGTAWDNAVDERTTCLCADNGHKVPKGRHRG